MCDWCIESEINEQGGVESWDAYGPPDPGPFDMTVKPNTSVVIDGKPYRFFGYIGSNRSGVIGWYGYQPNGEAVNFYKNGYVMAKKHGIGGDS